MTLLPPLVVAGLVVAASGAAYAQNAGTGPTVAKAPAATQRVAVQPAARPAPARAAPLVLPDATPDQLAASQMAHYGEYLCEFDQKLSVSVHKAVGGYIDVAFKGRSYVMKPVLSSTGALRLEDVTGRTLMIQIASKSMLMDTKAGQRLVDECVHPDQQLKTAQTAPAAPILSN